MNLPPFPRHVQMIGIAGRQSHGKSHIAKALERMRPTYVLAFAKPFKEQAACILDHYYAERAGSLPISAYEEHFGKETFIPELGSSLRDFYRKSGDEGRAYSENFWSDAAHLDILAHLRTYDLTEQVIIDDLRFPNEAAYVRSQGGFVIWVEDVDGPEVTTSHNSENSFFAEDADITILQSRASRNMGPNWLESVLRTVDFNPELKSEVNLHVLAMEDHVQQKD